MLFTWFPYRLDYAGHHPAACLSLSSVPHYHHRPHTEKFCRSYLIVCSFNLNLYNIFMLDRLSISAYKKVWINCGNPKKNTLTAWVPPPIKLRQNIKQNKKWSPLEREKCMNGMTKFLFKSKPFTLNADDGRIDDVCI